MPPAMPAFRTPAFHRLAGQTIWIDHALPELRPFRSADQAIPLAQIPADLASLAKAAPALQADGWLADRFSAVSLWRDEYGTLMEIPEAGRFWTDSDGSIISYVSQFSGMEAGFLAEALLGPPLVLALALRDTWCLHASAVEYDHQVIAFLGESGTGKSTLAAYLSDQPGVRRVADDILPVALESRRLSALPHFPQLKLPIDQQPGPALPERLLLSVLYLLEPQATISVEPLGPGNSALLLAGHTVAARIFDRQLLSRHFTFCSRAAADIPVRRLAYPHEQAGLPGVWDALQNDLAILFDSSRN
jgi:hypothetical protein